MCSVCKKVKYLLFKNLIYSPKIILKYYFYCIYKYIELNFEKDVLRNAKISKSSYQKIKKNINKFINTEYITIMSDNLGATSVKI
jgi:hypothetical protein